MANIFAQYMRPPKSVGEYSNEMDAAEQNQLQLAAAKLGLQDDQAMRQASMQAGGDQNKLLQLLQSGGQYKGAQALQKSMLDTQKTRADVDKTQAEVIDKTIGSFRSYVPQVATPEQAGQYAAAMYDHPVLGKLAAQFGSRDDVVKRNMEAYAKDPRAWMVNSAGVTADKLLESMKGLRQNVNLGGTSQGTTTNYYGEVVPGQTTNTPITQSADNVANNARMAAEGAANRGVQMRGQNMTDARSQQTISQGGKPPVGYRFTPDGNMEPIPGGPADSKAQALAAQKSAGATDVDSAVATLRDAYDRLEAGGGITSTKSGALGNMAASSSSSAIGQAMGKAFGTQNQSARNDVAMTRPALLAALMKATGMSAKQMDSNAELKLWLATATDPTLDVQSNRRALDAIERKYLATGSQPAKSSATPAGAKFLGFE